MNLPRLTDGKTEINVLNEGGHTDVWIRKTKIEGWGFRLFHDNLA